MKTDKKKDLAALFNDWAGYHPIQLERLQGSGSNRTYYKISGKDIKVIGTIGENHHETKAFLSFSDHFRKAGINVPEIYLKNEKKNIYLQEYLGETSLFDLLSQEKDSANISINIRAFYQQSLDALIRFQIDGNKGLDYSLCYPVREFDKRSMMWDLNYFKYYFLRPAGIDFNEAGLEEDFGKLTDFLCQADADFFMYRDFQSRNIMIHNDSTWFIDYQGGRKGALQYDLASLLFQAKASLSPDFRHEMLKYYLSCLSSRIHVNEKQFTNYYYGFTLIRMLQVLGAYGYRGYFEQKPHFIESASFALKNLQWFLDHNKLTLALPFLEYCLHDLISEKTRELQDEKILVVEINSFSYKKTGIPKDASGHGGGFVFDCRSLPNPGRFSEYQHLTGSDQSVIQFLEKEPAVKQFLKNSGQIVEQAVDNYLVRGFNHLIVSYGCTGGQHRSVYCTNRLAEKLRIKSGVKVLVRHRMQE